MNPSNGNQTVCFTNPVYFALDGSYESTLRKEVDIEENMIRIVHYQEDFVRGQTSLVDTRDNHVAEEKDDK